MEKKYIIELPENTHWIQWIMEGTKDHHPYMDFKQVEDLTPYAEPDLEQVRKEAYEQGHKDGYNKHDTEKIRKRGYDKGLDDIGNALRLLLFQYSNYTLQEIFGYDTARAVVEHFEGREIVARIRCYEGGVKQDVETIRKEAYDKGYENGFVAGHLKAEKSGQSFYEDGYKRGLADAWEAARKIGSNSMCSLKEMGFDFSRCAVPDYNPSWFVVKNYSASEAIEKIRQYEQEKEEQIQVGDEIETPSGLKGYVVNFTDDELVHYVSSEGRFGTMGTSAVSKTGRHFPEIAEVLQKMKES